MTADCAYCSAQGVYKIIVSGVVHSAVWNSLGATKAGLQVEQRRVQKVKSK